MSVFGVEAFVALIRDKVHALEVGTDPFFYNQRV
jgi:hypothetical protein